MQASPIRAVAAGLLVCPFARGTACRSVGAVPDTVLGRKFLNSPQECWYVMAVPMPYAVGSTSGTDHASPYSDDTHVPLTFYGLVSHPGTYRSHAEFIGLAITQASLLGVNVPRNVTGRVPAEAVARSEAPLRSQEDQGPGSSKISTRFSEPAPGRRLNGRFADPEA